MSNIFILAVHAYVHTYICSIYIQNENVDREVTSEKLIVDGRRPNHRLPFKCRKAKTDNFRWKVWWRWVHLMNGLAEGRLAIDDDIHQR